MSLRSCIQALRASASALARRPLFREGARDAAPIAIGLAAWGIVAGVAMSKSDMGIPLAIFMALIVFVGSAQVAVMPLIASDAPMWVVWGATFCISLRFLAFSYHYRPYFAQLPRCRRIALSYLMSDTNFGFFIQRFPQVEADRNPGDYSDYFLGGALLTFAVWQASIITGIVAGAAIPSSWQLSFAGTMALLALTCSMLRDRATWVAAIVAACAAVAAYALPLRLNIVVAIAAAVAVGAMARHLRPRADGASP